MIAHDFGESIESQGSVHWGLKSSSHKRIATIRFPSDLRCLQNSPQRPSKTFHSTLGQSSSMTGPRNSSPRWSMVVTARQEIVSTAADSDVDPVAQSMTKIYVCRPKSFSRNVAGSLMEARACSSRSTSRTALRCTSSTWRSWQPRRVSISVPHHR